MKVRQSVRSRSAAVAVALCATAFACLSPMAETIETRLGTFEFVGGYPTDETAQKLYDELDFQRAVQAYLWAYPMASYGAMADAAIEKGAGPSAVHINEKSALPDTKLLTGNQDTPYMSGVLDLSGGPMVMEMPPGLLGTLCNIWQQPLTDLGGPWSMDQGRGGKFLIVPPGYDGPMPDTAFHVVQSDSNTVFWYVRAIPKTKADFPKLVELMQTYRQYRFSDAANPPQMKHIMMSDVTVDYLPNEGFAFFETLARYINENPPRAQDMAMLGMLETLGIAHGKPFQPGERMKRILTEAAEVGRAMIKTVAWKPRMDKSILYMYPGKRQWKKLFAVDDVTFHTPDYLIIDQRSRFGFEAIGTSRSMTLAIPGVGSQYITLYTDESGEFLTGDSAYRIHIPKDVPAAMFWSVTIYDNETRSQITNDLGRPLVGTVHGASPNRDGSFDLYFSPELPDGVPEENWVQTKPGLGWFAYLRIYGPEQAWYDKTWMPSDAVKVN